MSPSASVEDMPVSPADVEPVVARTEKSSARDKSGRSTSHLKIVPETLELREHIKREAERYAKTLDKSRAFTKAQLEQHGRKLLTEINQPEKYLGFAMVMIGNFFWKKQFLSLPFN